MHKNEHNEIEALTDWVTVTRRKAEERTEAGIHLPDTVRANMEAEYVGTVVSIGADAQTKIPTLKLGDRIVYQRCFPMNKTGDKDMIYSLIHVGWIMGRVHSERVRPAMAPTNEKFKQD